MILEFNAATGVRLTWSAADGFAVEVAGSRSVIGHVTVAQAVEEFDMAVRRYCCRPRPEGV